MQLTPHQREQYSNIITYLSEKIVSEDETTFLSLLYGAAGVGKSTLMKQVVSHARKSLKYNVACVAFSHKARKVLDRIVNEKSFFKVATMTVASLLNKTRSHHYIGTDRYKSDGANKINNFDFFVIDEVSMVDDESFDEIIKYAKTYKKKILFIGDIYQIPHPTQRMKITNIDGNDAFCEKKDSKAFELKRQFQLTEIIRQDSSNTMISYYNRIRNNLYSDSTFEEVDTAHVHITEDKIKFEDMIREHLIKDIYSRRIVCYTNNNVSYYNRLVRNYLGYDKEFVVGELLMGYVNSGFPVREIENGQEYIIDKIKVTITHRILTKDGKLFKDLAGEIVSIQELEPNGNKGTIQNKFFPDVDDDANYDILMELTRRAERVNKQGSSKKDFVMYSELKQKLIFRKNIFKFGNTIESEDAFRETHPLLFTQVLDVMVEDDESGERIFLDNELTRDLDDKYEEIREYRKMDSKPFNDSELLADRFQILEKDIDYGYSVTCHKMQGSTYSVTFIDDTDFDKIKNGWNYRMNMQESRIKERNQLRYVAYTRAKDEIFVLSAP